MTPNKTKSAISPMLKSLPQSSLSSHQMKEYVRQLQVVDPQTASIVKRTINQATWTYWSAFVLYILSHILPIALMGFGLYFKKIQPDDSAVSIFCIASGIIALIIVSNRNPLKNVRNLMLHAMKVNIIYSGYIRQIYQVDSAFQKLFPNSKGIDPLKLEEMLKQVQDITNEATDAIDHVLDKMDD